MDANLALLWMASATCLAIALRVLTLRSRQALSWVAACGAVLAIEAAVYLLRPAVAGFVGAGLCALFVLTPLYAGASVTRLAARRRFRAARALARAVRVLHPTRAFGELPGYVDVLERLHRGELDAAALPKTPPATPLARFVYAHALRAAGRFAELLAFIESLPPDAQRGDPGMAVSRVRALAELGQLEAMLEAHARIESTPALAGVRDLSRLIVSARLGRSDLVERLIAGPVARALPADGASFWRATALQVSGDPRAQPMLEQLATRDPDTARAARQRLAAPFARLDLAALPASAREAVQQLQRELESSRGLVDGASGPMTVILLVSLGAVFALELPGGSTDIYNLIDLGALVIPASPEFDQPWRLLTAAWLHLGATHLIMNALGLWVLGRPVESILGPQRMFIVYVTSALAGNVAAQQLLTGAVLVGASGGVMGLLGALLAVTLRRFRTARTRFLRAHLWNWLLVIAIQVFFDLSMPAVSSTAHIGGFAAGLLLGLLLSAERSLARR
jgi:rhomboid protease GluP